MTYIDSDIVRYAWIITRDCKSPYGDGTCGHYDLPLSERDLCCNEHGMESFAHLDGTYSRELVGIGGPSSVTDDETWEALKNGTFFRIRDDDGNVYYEGRFWASDSPDSESEYAFSPLDDFGRPSLGATDIQYRINREWVAL